MCGRRGYSCVWSKGLEREKKGREDDDDHEHQALAQRRLACAWGRCDGDGDGWTHALGHLLAVLGEKLPPRGIGEGQSLTELLGVMVPYVVLLTECADRHLACKAA